ncbi:fibronectin type III domain-containing protein [Pelobacter seleniigenes]|uniref:fibronectin type III domain-containing protein n=1 Tax=Pelobacter seleniigenes TaxID=407188 RepID=UPI0004A75C61|nr:fibronectin type III domain-containing protein [Pelobacter seleniigenes]
MKISLISILVTLLVCLASPSFALDITLSWDASPSDSVAGYKVYYNKGDDTLPLEGTGAIEGDSPIDVGDNLSAKLSGLDDNAVYYFSVTAYDGSGNESTFSNIVNNSWQPQLVSPSNQQRAAFSPVLFEWEAAPVGYDVSYILFYGTDRQEVENAGLLPPVSPIKKLPPPHKLLPTFFFSALLVFFFGRIKVIRQRLNPAPLMAGALLTLSLALTACGGGGGSGSGSDNGSTVDNGSTPSGTVFSSVDTGTVTSQTIYDLETGTTYYWKVVAVDETNAALEYQSDVYSFTTN